MRVVDVWASPATFQAFEQTLIRIVQAVGVDPGQPTIAEVRNTATG